MGGRQKQGEDHVMCFDTLLARDLEILQHGEETPGVYSRYFNFRVPTVEADDGQGGSNEQGPCPPRACQYFY